MKQNVWFITGVSKGLGRELARQAVETGNIVIGTVRNAEDKVAFEDSMDAKAFIIDLAATDQIPMLISSVIKEYGRIDVLVNNAGFGAFGMIEEFDEEEIINQFNVNFIAVWKLAKQYFHTCEIPVTERLYKYPLAQELWLGLETAFMLQANSL